MTGPDWVQAMAADWIGMTAPVVPLGVRSMDGRVLDLMGEWSLRGMAPVDNGSEIVGMCTFMHEEEGVLHGAFKLRADARAAVAAGEMFLSPMIVAFTCHVQPEPKFTIVFTRGEFASFMLKPVLEAPWYPWPPELR